MNPKGKRPDDAALLRYVSGESPLAETQYIDEWLATDADLAAAVRELRAAWNSGDGAAAPAWDKGQVWRNIAAEMRAPRVSGPRVSGPRKIAAFGVMERRGWMTYAIAASLLMAIGLTSLVMWKREAREQVAEARTWREVVTARGQQAVLDLADGSRVTLAADTRLRIPSDFATRRELELRGRGFFNVVHDTTRPFVVRTATSVTEDIGTAFVVTDFGRMAEVAVTEGSVALVENEKRLMVLERGDVATLDSAGTATRRRVEDVDRYASWTRGVLSIDNMLLRDAIPELERWYDIDIRLGDARLGDRRVTAQLTAEPAARAAERLARALGVRAINESGNAIRLTR